MPWAVAAAAVGAGAGIFEGSQAADAQKSAGDQAKKAQELGYQRSVGALGGYNEAGNDSIKALMSALGIGSGGSQGGFNMDFLRNAPGYQFQKQEGEDAITHARSALGGVNSGETLKELDQFGTGLADSNIAKYLAQLMGTAQLGESAGGGIASAASGVANNTGNINLQQGNTSAAQSVAQGQSITNLFNNPQVLAALQGGGTNYSGTGIIDYGGI